MLGFGGKKKKEEEEREQAEQERVSQAMRTMSDQIASQAQEIKRLEDALDDAKDNGEADQKLSAAQAELRKLKMEMARMRAEAARAAATAAAGDDEGKGASAGAAGAAGAIGVTKIGPKTPAAEAGTTLGGAAAPAAAPGGLSVGVTAYVRQAGGKNLRLRNGPGLDTVAFAGLPPGTSMTLLEGPVEDDGYPWWRIRTVDGREGWVAGTELVTSPE